MEFVATMRVFTAARHESALNGRLSRFLGYAAGEIFLIVVGILLALQISEWNTRRVHYDEARQYLARLDAELSSHQAELADQINLTTIRMESVNVLLRAVETKVEQIDLDQVYDALGRTNNIKQLSLSTSVYEESGSPGKDYLLRDPDLQNTLGSYYAEIQQEKSLNDIGLRFQWRQFYNPFIVQHLNATRMHQKWAEQTFGQELGMYVVDLPVAPFWSLPIGHPLKRQFVNELSAYNSGLFYAQHVQETLLASLSDIQAQIADILAGKAD